MEDGLKGASPGTLLSGTSLKWHDRSILASWASNWSRRARRSLGPLFEVLGGAQFADTVLGDVRGSRGGRMHYEVSAHRYGCNVGDRGECPGCVLQTPIHRDDSAAPPFGHDVIHQQTARTVSDFAGAGGIQRSERGLRRNIGHFFLRICRALPGRRAAQLRANLRPGHRVRK